MEDSSQGQCRTVLIQATCALLVMPIELWVKVIDNNIDKFKTTLFNISWNFISDDVDTQTSDNLFWDTFNNLNLYFSKQIIKFIRNLHSVEPWMTPGLSISRNNIINLSSKYSKEPSNFNAVTYKYFNQDLYEY